MSPIVRSTSARDAPLSINPQQWANVKLKRSTFGLTETKLLIVDLKLGLQSIPFIIDTGAAFSAINFAAAEYLKVVPLRARYPRTQNLDDAFGGTVDSYELNLPLVSCGQKKMARRRYVHRRLVILRANWLFRKTDRCSGSRFPWGATGGDRFQIERVIHRTLKPKALLSVMGKSSAFIIR